jgi:hypothetical protein
VGLNREAINAGKDALSGLQAFYQGLKKLESKVGEY